MFSRRTFLLGLFLFTPIVLSPIQLLNRIQDSVYKRGNKKFVKQGWVLQEGDI